MRLVSPALFHLRYLAVHPDGYSNDTIKDRFEEERLDYISDQYIDKVRAALKPPTPFYPTTVGHKRSFSFINGERLFWAFNPNDAMRAARNLLTVPRAKEFVEAMMLVRVPLPAIAAYVAEHQRIVCTIESLKLYQHYFWNIDLLDATEMRVMMSMRFENAADRIPELKDKKKVLTSAYYKDPRKVAADLPFSPTTAMLTQMRLGIRPSKTDLTLRMMEARDLAVVRAIEAVQQDGPNDSMKFLNYVNGGRILEELLQLVVKPESQLQDQLRTIALRTEMRDVVPIHQLSEGRHTVDVAPIEETDAEQSREIVAGRSSFDDEGRADR